MDKPKTKLVKSKSSNSAITTKSETRKHNKKSRSSGEFQPLILKKRGVYVEKKATNISINERDISPVDENLPLQYDSDVIATRNIVRSGTQDVKSDAPLLPKVPSSPNYSRPIPRPGRKRFLTSVLTILSKATTGTQYPDIDSYKFKRIERAKMRLKKKKDEEIIQEDPIASSNYSKRRSKYRSRIFNDDDSELEQLVVLQSTKEITHTPSNESGKSDNFKDTTKEPEGVRWADIFPTLCKKKLDIPMLEDIKEVPPKIEQPVVKIVEKDPSTLVAEVPKKDDNKKFYNFFVDLLETTFNVYNVKTEFNPPAVSSVNSSKVALEIDESVAKKLNIKNKEPVSEDVTRKPSFKHFYCIKPDGEDSWNDKQLLDHFQPKSVRRSRTTSPSKSTKRRRKLQSESFNTKTTKPLPLTQSVILPKKVILKKDRKKNFINLLKQQLKMDDDAFDEPQNFYQALKVIARNKRRCQKSIHIKEAKKPSEGDVHVCQFKRRRLLSASTKSSSKKSAYRPESDILRNSFTRSSDITSSTKKCTTITITETTENEIPSQHSLEVFGFDYEPVPKKLPDAFPSFPPSASTSMQDYNINQPSYMKDSDSGTTSVVSGRRQSAKLGPFLSGLIE